MSTLFGGSDQNAAPRSKSMRGMLARGHLRLVIFAVLLAAIGLMVSGSFLIRGYAAANVSLTARTVAYTVEPAVLFNDRTAVQEAIGSIGGTGSIDQIEVFAASGERLANWQRPHDGVGGWFEEFVSELLWVGPASVEIAYDDQVIGSVRVFGSSAAILRYGFAGIIIALCCLGLTIIATSILARRLEENVIAPLEHVSAVAHDVRSQRNFDRRVSPSGIEEIDRLGQDFNALLNELQSWHKSLTSENQKLAHRADHDTMTGLGNRSRFNRELEDLVERGKETEQAFALLYVDTDNFKEINDTHGHDVGDVAIRTIAERLQLSVRNKQSVFRLGGDEFAVLVEEIADDGAIARIVDRIRRNMASPFSVAISNERKLTVSIGTATFPQDGRTGLALMRVADARMYEQKRMREGNSNESD